MVLSCCGSCAAADVDVPLRCLSALPHLHPRGELHALLSRRPHWLRGERRRQTCRTWRRSTPGCTSSTPATLWRARCRLCCRLPFPRLPSLLLPLDCLSSSVQRHAVAVLYPVALNVVYLARHKAGAGVAHKYGCDLQMADGERGAALRSSRLHPDAMLQDEFGVSAGASEVGDAAIASY